MNRLRELREEKGYSLKALGEKVGMSASVLGNYERGDRSPKIDVWEKLANFFNVSIPYILGLSDERTNLSEELKGKLESVIYDKTNIDASVTSDSEIYVEILTSTFTDLISTLLSVSDGKLDEMQVSNILNTLSLLNSVASESDLDQVEKISSVFSFINNIYSGNIFYNFDEDYHKNLRSSSEALSSYLSSKQTVSAIFDSVFSNYYSNYFD
ncbi:helix-turn-helix domain-containing protein [Enterococcus faecium]|uniref:helix-turn-helix domain-containing protein n=1 Tax=Enterococcus faecium TaxID=1352 RepID=UPI0038B64F5F